MCGSEEFRRLDRLYSECGERAYDPYLRHINLSKFLECVKEAQSEG